MDLIVGIRLLVPASEIPNDISDYWETNTGILGLLWECLLAETLGWLKYRTLGLLQVGGTRIPTLRWHVVVEALCFCTVHERMEVVEVGVVMREKRKQLGPRVVALYWALQGLRFLHV